jgi:hypothetical protein
MLPSIAGIDNTVSLGGEKHGYNGLYFGESVHSFGSVELKFCYLKKQTSIED